jgi:hypothetical protein
LVTGTSDPFTDDFLPIFNSPTWTGAGFPTDPVGQLTRYNGLSTLGTWNLRVADQFSPDSGTLNQWSMIVTPRTFTCTPFTPSASTVSVSGRVVTADGRGLRNAYVILTDQSGVPRHAITSSFGYYRFDNVRSGETYVAEISSKRFAFTPRVVNVTDDVTGLDFVAQP